MGGLALGSRLGGRIADRLHDRLRAYAIAEAGIGLYALAVPLVLAAFPSMNAAMYPAFGPHELVLMLGRFVAASALLILPTPPMGATRPLLSRHFVPPDGAAPPTVRALA